ncbi:MAG: zinc metallopeptidase [Deltaproteobacteria bacterium]|nr:zinc metallopeptidase [Deltaproteobacteria bacterium]
MSSPSLDLLVLLSLPFALTAVASGLHALTGRWLRVQEPAWLSRGAGSWVLEHVGRHPGLRAGITPDHLGGQDGWWPALRAVGLSRQVWYDHHPQSRAIAAHELGHALLAWRHPWLGTLAEAVRLVHQLLTQAAPAALLVAAIFGEPRLLELGWGLTALAAISHAAVLVDEGWASVMGGRLLRESDAARYRRQTLPPMLTALSSYGAGLAGRLLVLWGWAPLTAGLREGMHLAIDPALAVWLLVMSTPLLLLRGASLIQQVRRPVEIRSSFRLATIAQEEGAWASATGLILGAWALALPSLQGGAGLAGLTVLAAISAMGPLGQLARAVAMVPVAVGVQVLSSGLGLHPHKVVEPVGATPWLESESLLLGWSTRVQALLHLAWLPLLAVVWIRLLTGM